MQLEQFGCRLEKNLCFSIPSVVLVNLEHRETEQLEDETISQTYVSQVFLRMRAGPHSERGACFRIRTSKYVLQQFTSPCLRTRCCNTHFPFSPVECSSPALILFMTTTIFGTTHCHNWQHTFRFLLLPFRIFSLSILNEEEPSDSLLKRGCQIWRGSRLVPICANGGARRPAPEAFDGAKLAHAHKNRLIITSSVDPGKSCRQQLLILSIAGLLDQQRRFSFTCYG